MRRKFKSYTGNLMYLAQAKEKTGFTIINEGGSQKSHVRNINGEIIFSGYYMSCVDFIVKESRNAN